MKESKDITIEKYYNYDVASIKDGVTENLINLKAIVVSVNEYPRYKFLIEEPGKITKVLSEEIKDTTEITDFKDIEEFEKDIMDQTNEGNEDILVSTDILKDVNKFEEAIKDKEKLEYIIEHPEIFIDSITQDKDIGSTLLKNEDAVDLIIGNDEWRDKILEDDSTQILDNSGVINLPTANLEIHNPSTGMGNVLVSAYLRNDKIHSPINAFIGGTPGASDWESPSLPAYIGCDFGEENEVWIYKVYTKPGNNTAPTKMYLESSNDNVNWERVYEFTKYTTPMNETTEVIRSDKNNKKARYWRLYITESINKSYVDLLKIQFYGK